MIFWCERGKLATAGPDGAVTPRVGVVCYVRRVVDAWKSVHRVHVCCVLVGDGVVCGWGVFLVSTCAWGWLVLFVWVVGGVRGSLYVTLCWGFLV